MAGIYKGRPGRDVMRERQRLLLNVQPSAREVFAIRDAERRAAEVKAARS